MLGAPAAYWCFLRDLRTYRQLLYSSGSASTPQLELHPALFDRTLTSPIDPHYAHQAAWAFRRVVASGASHHIDVGSDISFVVCLTAVAHVTFIDIRPLPITLPNLTSCAGNVRALPFADGSVRSLSCLHVAEHVGLGRYGDALDPDGTRRACAELARVLARGGDLYFSAPVGRPRICFNAHRIHAPRTIREYFGELALASFSAVDDNGRLWPDVDVTAFAKAEYACGLFHLRRG